MTDLARYRAEVSGSNGEETLAGQLRMVGIPFVRQFHFGAGWTPPKKYAADFAIGETLLVEVDGAVWTHGRHSRGDADYARDAWAIIHGWTVLRVSTGQVESGQALQWIEAIRERMLCP